MYKLEEDLDAHANDRALEIYYNELAEVKPVGEVRVRKFVDDFDDDEVVEVISGNFDKSAVTLLYPDY